jgi:hypothetical protein
MIVADGTLEAYEAYDALFTQSTFAPEVREWVVRQRKMLAWNEAVTINTAASYRAFLALYPDTDLSLTARTLIERLRFRPAALPQVAAICTPPSTPAVPSAPSSPALKKVDISPAQTPVITQPVIIKKVSVDPPLRQLPPRHEVYLDEPVHGGMPMRPVYRPMGFGMRYGLGGGMMGKPMGGFGRRF